MRNEVKALRVRVEREFTLQPLWYDEGWHESLLEDGLTEDQALREMLRVSWEEDWTSLIEEMIQAADLDERARVFAEQAVIRVEVVTVTERTT